MKFEDMHIATTIIEQFSDLQDLHYEELEVKDQVFIDDINERYTKACILRSGCELVEVITLEEKAQIEKLYRENYDE